MAIRQQRTEANPRLRKKVCERSTLILGLHVGLCIRSTCLESKWMRVPVIVAAVKHKTSVHDYPVYVIEELGHKWTGLLLHAQ